MTYFTGFRRNFLNITSVSILLLMVACMSCSGKGDVVNGTRSFHVPVIVDTVPETAEETYPGVGMALVW